MKILLVEDDAVIGDLVRAGLEEARHVVEWRRDGDLGLQSAKTGDFDLLILDLMLPGLDGISLCRALRQKGIRTPILMLTARGSVDERVTGLEAGADDYLPKPFDFRELLARVNALLRREQTHKTERIFVADLELDLARRSVKRAGVEIALSPREYELLELLARFEGRVLSREMIQSRVWRDESQFSNVLEATIRNLRRKIDDGREPKLIHTAHRQGYVLKNPEQRP